MGLIMVCWHGYQVTLITGLSVYKHGWLSVQVKASQGSILGPLLYILFTNELPEIVHSQCSAGDREAEDVWPDYTMQWYAVHVVVLVAMLMTPPTAALGLIKALLQKRSQISINSCLNFL